MVCRHTGHSAPSLAESLAQALSRSLGAGSRIRNVQCGALQWAAATGGTVQSSPGSRVAPGHCFAFFTMVPTAEMTVVLEPLALVVTVTTAGRVAVVVRMVG